MNKAEFITLIDNPKNLDKSHITALRNIAADFPYFQASHILLSKALFNENHYEFEKQLKSTALIVSDREQLYRFLHNIHIEEPNNVSAAEEEIAVLPEEFVQQFVEPIPVENIIEQIVEIPIVEELEEIVEPLQTIVEPVPVESVIEQIVETPIVEELKDIVEPLQTIVEPIEPEPIQHKNEIHSFTEWLLLGIDGINIGNTEKESRKQEDESENNSPSEVNKPTNNVHAFDSILDKFIKENPSISRPKAEFYNPSHMVKHSNEEDDDLVTETLATIYYKQGAFKKAIRTYEKLCLIYPHKMTYFADLIQKIKQEIKND